MDGAMFKIILLFLAITGYFYHEKQVVKNTALQTMDLIYKMEIAIEPDGFDDRGLPIYSDKKTIIRETLIDCQDTIYNHFSLWR